MSKTQLSQYLGKVHIIPLVKIESRPVSKIYSAEREQEGGMSLSVVGETHEEKLKNLVETVPIHHLLLAIAIGDVHLNGLSHTQASMKYGFSKSKIQRVISGKTEHKKGGKQYQSERKRKGDEETGSSSQPKKLKDEEGEEEDDHPVPVTFEGPKEEEEEILPDLVDDNEFPDVKIDAKR